MPVPPLPSEDLEHVFGHTRGLWEELRGQRIFITGGTGFFGFWLVESFLFANDRLALGAKLTILTRDPEGFAAKAPHVAGHAAITLHRGDVRNFVFPAGSFGYAIHAATEASAKLNAEAPLEMVSVIVDGTRHVLAFAAEAGVRKLLFTSSGAVYGKQPPEMTHIPEDYSGAPDPLDPASAYGEGKRFAEHLCVLHGRLHGFEVKIARCFAFVGPHLPLDTHFAIGNFIRDALRGGPIQVGGDGTPYRSYLYGSDLAVWLWTILFRGLSGRACNVGSGSAITIAELASLVASESAKSIRVEIKQQPPKQGGAARYVPDVSRAAREYDLCEMIDLPGAVRKTAAWYR